MDYIRFFFGTPGRLFVWLVLVGMVTVMAVPGLLETALNRLLSEVFGPLATLAIIYLGYRVMFKGFVGGGGSRRRR